MVWRRMAYFSDATAHAAVLGVALSLALSLPVFYGALAIALIMALFVTRLTGTGHSSDTLLGVLAHSTLAFGIVAVSLLPGAQFDLMSYLVGDILSVSHMDLVLIWVGAVLVVALLAWRWNALLLATLNSDLAFAEGLSPGRENLIQTFTLATVIAVSIKVVGVLLIGALLIIPAAAARPFCNTPERMALCAVLIGMATSLGGLQASLIWEVPAGPAIVCTAGVCFALSLALRGLMRSRPRSEYH
jgi:zinc transport system permease protein